MKFSVDAWDPSYGTSLDPELGTSSAEVCSVLSTFQYRARRASVSRAAPASLASTVDTASHALPCGFSGPGGLATESTSTTRFAVPSTVMSSRTQKKCWWFGP